MKKMLALLLAAVMVLGLMAGCAGEEKPAETTAAAAVTEAPAANAETAAPAEGAEDYSDITVAWVSPLVAHEFYDYAKQGMEACAKEYGFQTYWTGADDHSNEGMIEAMEACLADGVDAIATVPLSESAWLPILTRCKEEGIPVAAAAAEVSGDLTVGYVGTDNPNVGRKMMEEAHKKAGTDELYVGVLMSNLDTGNQVIQRDAAAKYLEEHGIEAGIVDIRETMGDPNTALDVATNMFTAYPEINVCLSFTGEGGASAAQAAKQLGRDVIIIGMDDSGLTLDAIRDGSQYASMAQNCFKWGYYSTKMAFLAKVGRLDEMESTYIDSGVVMITKDNVDNYAEELYVMP